MNFKKMVLSMLTLALSIIIVVNLSGCIAAAAGGAGYLVAKHHEKINKTKKTKTIETKKITSKIQKLKQQQQKR